MALDTWTNWAATSTATGQRTQRPRDPHEIARAITDARQQGHSVRPLGSGHSFSDIAAPRPPRERTGAVALDLSAWTGITDVDRGNGLVTARGGTPLHQLNAELDELGLALPNLGDIDGQTIAGAVSTGTHGTGARLGGLATLVRALELVRADGSVLRCSPEQHPDVFAAARVGLGALGLISTVTLRCVPAFSLAAEEHPLPLDEVLRNFDDHAADNDHFEFYWFPHTARTLVKRNNRLPEATPTRPLHPVRSWFEYRVLENELFGAVCRLGRRRPGLVPALNRLCATSWSGRSYSDRAHRVFVTGREVRFVESEYAVPREHLPAVLNELRAAVRRLHHPVMFPVEVRVAAADDIWLSTAHERPTAYVAVHQFSGMPHREWFDTFERIARAADGRPHWGKMHGLSAAQLRESYPRFDDFLRVRRRLDPERVFGNPHLERVLGE
ncbi:MULTISPECIES: D-arabinono-1,4-lactone oxidase [unclassified Actinopolyspora]|uniref:D-arabinono-1,4-lactone oxidase n=1 Tax=unclassified Actinopolyspora TaxID=2639451 RepID=UPI0013F6078F|nr:MULTISPECIES: D-arabinono-1,4-lactone oxidase [unclassified Actinopolyspora]NHD18890.1 FAD-binding protein [Actinopolyspora sp. BKK2]NHE77313.1 FAD-binding protein [Actinopolyspora sp. BKK1]